MNWGVVLESRSWMDCLVLELFATVHHVLMCFPGFPLVELMYLVPGESYRRQLRSWLLWLSDAFRALTNSLAC